MSREHNRKRSSCPQRISRRNFIKLAAMTGLLAGCRSTRQVFVTATPTATQVPTNTPTPTSSLTSTPITQIRRPEIIKFYPDGPSKVVHTHHTGVWDGDSLVPQAIRQMLDASITELTSLNDATEAWASLFHPGERIAIKVNTIDGSEVWTHVPLAMAVAQSLQDAGVPAEQIIVFDRAIDELESAGYPINLDRPGVRCYGTGNTYNGGNYTAGWTLANSDISLSDILLSCDALINVPVLKAHSISGTSFGLKNHYGTFDRPWDFHQPRIGEAIAELNALPPIKDRARLVIGDVLSASLVPRASSPYWTQDAVGDSILMSFDTVAHDTVGLQIFTEMVEANDGNPALANRLANPWLQNCAELGLGTNDPDNIELVEVSLG